ncbi:MAG: glycoside hydrolase family 9 protein [Planctomycetota bacterium]|jgi:hypothetical protein
MLRYLLLLILFTVTINAAENQRNLLHNGNFKQIVKKTGLPTHWYIPKQSAPLIKRENIPGYDEALVITPDGKFINLSQRITLPQRENELFSFTTWFRSEKLLQTKQGFETSAILRFEFFTKDNKRIDHITLNGQKRPWIITRDLPKGDTPWSKWQMLVETPVNAHFCVFSLRLRNLSGRFLVSNMALTTLDSIEKKETPFEDYKASLPLLSSIKMSDGALPAGWFIPYSKKDVSKYYIFNKGEDWLTLNDADGFPPVETGFVKKIFLGRADVFCRLADLKSRGGILLFWGDSYSTHIRTGKWWYELRYQSGTLILKKQGHVDILEAVNLPKEFFQKDKWYKLSLTVPRPGKVRALINDKTQLELTDPNPPEELSGLFRIVASRCKAHIKEVSLTGKVFEKKKAAGRQQYRDGYGRVYTKAVEIPLLKKDKETISALSPLKTFTCKGVRKDLKEISRKYKDNKLITYNLKEKDNNLFLSISNHRELDLPTQMEMQFNLAESGNYTLYFSGRGGENFPNILEATLNDREIYRDVQRGSGLWGGYPYFKIKIPLKMIAGPQRLKFIYHPPKLTIPYLKKTFYGYGFGFDTVSLTEGLDETPPVYETVWRHAVKNIKIHAQNDIWNHQTMDPDFSYEITEIPQGEYEVELGVRDDHIDLPYQRIFNLYLQGDLLRENLDPAAAAERVGFPIIIKKKVAVGEDGKITVRAKRKDCPSTKALLNYIKIYKDGKLAALVNCGRFTHLPDINPVRYLSPRGLIGRPKRARAMWIEDKGKGVFEKNNLVANPGFESELVKEESEYKLIRGWNIMPRTSTIFTPKLTDGSGTVTRDGTAKYKGNNSVKIAETKGTFGICANITFINRFRPFTFSGWVKSKNATGKTYLQIEWLKRRPFFKKTSGDWDYDFARSSVVESKPINGSAEWQKIEVKAMPPEDAVAMSFIIRSDNNSGEVWFDNLHCDAIGSAEAEILYSQGGYDITDIKKPVIAARLEDLTGTIKLIDVKSGKTALEKKTRYIGKDKWVERFCYSADFSEFKTPGIYRWSVSLEALPEIKSDEFQIKQSFWQQQSELCLLFHRIVRSGDSYPEWNPKGQHKDDFRLPIPHYQRGPITLRKGANIDGTGGWYDAADHGLFMARSISAIYTLSEMLETADKLKSKDTADLKSRIIDELQWGLKKFIKLSLPNGMMYQILAYVHHTDNIQYTGDERVPLGIGQPYNYFGSLAKAAYVLKKLDAEKAEEVYQKALLSYSQAVKSWYKTKDIAEWKAFFIQPKFLLAELYLYLYSSDKAMLEKAQQRIRKITQHLQKKTYQQKEFVGELAIGASGMSFGLDFIDFPAQFARHFPEDAVLADYKVELKKYLDTALVMQCQRTPLGQVTHFDPSHPKPFLCYSSTVFGFPAVASAYASASDLLKDKKYLAHGQRQLQWMLGRNVLGLSLIGGVGKKQCAQDHGYEEINAATEGRQLPGAVSKGINIGRGTLNRFWGTPFGTPYASAQTRQAPNSHYEFIQMPTALQMLATWKMELSSHRDF